MASSATDSQGRDKDIRQKLVETGHVDVMVSVGNNFFYTKSLPCSLWFFDKGKDAERLDKVLFIDARNYYTVVDRTLNEWTDWQLKNLNAIVWLYRGETEKYRALIDAYYRELSDRAVWLRDSETQRLATCYGGFAEVLKSLESFKQKQLERIAFVLKDISKRDRKKTEAEWAARIAEVDEAITVAKEAVWLVDKFGEGEYRDIPGLCRVAEQSEIEARGWSLTPGAYVGVAPVEDDGVDFKTRMLEIHAELLTLQSQSNELMETISRNMEELGI